jgi:hypothetical protein
MFSRPVSSSSTVATLTGEADAAAHLVGLAANVVAGHPGGAAGRLGQRRHHPHRGGLARAVGAEQSKHGARRDGEADTIDSGVIAEPLHEVDRFDGEFHATDRIGAHRHQAIAFPARATAKCHRRPACLRADTVTRGSWSWD